VIGRQKKGKNGTYGNIFLGKEGKNGTYENVFWRKKGKNGTYENIFLRKTGKNGTYGNSRPRKGPFLGCFWALFSGESLVFLRTPKSAGEI
jgi:hypothetical protein